MNQIEDSKYKALIEQSLDGIVLTNEQGHITLWNNAMATITGIKPGDAIGMPLHEVQCRLIPEEQKAPELLEQLRNGLKNILASKAEWPGESREQLIVCADGTRKVVQDSSFLVKTDAGMNFGTILRDISEKKKAEETLHQAEEKYRTLFDTMAQGVVYQNDAGEITSCNAAAERILGLTKDQMQGRTSIDPHWKAIHEDGSSFPGETHPSMVALKYGKAVLNTIMGVFHPQKNDYAWIMINAIPLFKQNEDKVCQVYTTFTDITERKRVDEAIRAEHSFAESIIETAQAIVLVLDIEGRIVRYNKYMENLSGRSLDETKGKDWFSTFLPKGDHGKIRELFKKAVCDMQTRGNINPIVCKDGSLREIEWYDKTLRDSNGNPIGLLAIGQDVTYKRRIEEELHKTQKLESLGILAGGIAHDFNNLMCGVFGYIDMAREETRESKVTSYLSKAMNTIERARALTGQLLTFAKGGAPIQKIDHLFPFVEETAKFALSGSNVSCSFNVPEDLWACNFDKNQIGQVIDNIIINAQQAMPAGGTIEVSARNITLEEKEHPVLLQGNYVKISITDTGIGIPKEILSRIFDPFFTTKAKGHGLGLATCYSIIKRHGGCIDVESEPGKGSTFHIYLPASTETFYSAKKKIGKTHHGSGTFLVMDDEEVMRETISDMLGALGYTVVRKNNGQEAIDFYHSETKSNRTIVGMIFDLTVPGGMGGKAAIEEIRKLNKDIPAFVASGYAEDPVMKNPAEYGFSASICKPFMRKELTEMLNSYMKQGK